MAVAVFQKMRVLNLGLKPGDCPMQSTVCTEPIAQALNVLHESHATSSEDVVFLVRERLTTALRIIANLYKER